MLQTYPEAEAVKPQREWDNEESGDKSAVVIATGQPHQQSGTVQGRLQYRVTFVLNRFPRLLL
jgi:hypothetical protein